jgi:hypothetical protein
MTPSVDEMKLEKFLEYLPLLHSWDYGKTWSSGGFGRFHLNRISQLLKRLAADFTVIETRVGNSTPTFLLCRAICVVVIAPDQALFGRTGQHAKQRSINSDALRPVVALSDDALPQLAAEAKKDNCLCDFALIDGGHTWQTVFADFCYIMAMLKSGMIDDVQLFSVKRLARLLDESHEFSSAIVLKKSLIFRKNAASMRMKEFGTQCYTTRMTEVKKAGGDEFTLHKSRKTELFFERGLSAGAVRHVVFCEQRSQISQQAILTVGSRDVRLGICVIAGGREAK